MRWFALALVLTACTENLPTNETSEPQAAGHAAIEALGLPLCYTHSARTQTKEVAMNYAFGFSAANYCIDSAGSSMCYSGPAPHDTSQARTQIMWGQGVIPSSQASDTYLVPAHGAAERFLHLQCTCSACTVNYY